MEAAKRRRKKRERRQRQKQIKEQDAEEVATVKAKGVEEDEEEGDGAQSGTEEKGEASIDPFDSLADNDFTAYLEMHKREMRGPYMTKAENKALREVQRR